MAEPGGLKWLQDTFLRLVACQYVRREQCASVSSLQVGMSAPTDKKLSVWGREVDVGWSQLACALSTCWMKGIYCHAWKQESHRPGSYGVEGSGRRLHSFRSYVMLTRQRLAGLPHSRMSQTGLEAVQTDSSSLGWNPTPAASLHWRAETVRSHIACGAVQASLVVLLYLVHSEIRTVL